MKIEISDSCIESMRKLGMIIDYTDDGFVLHEDAGWQPAGDVIEYFIGMEEFEFEKAKETYLRSVERRAGTEEKETQTFTQR